MLTLNIVKRNDVIISLSESINQLRVDKADKISLTIVAIFAKLEELKNVDNKISELSAKKALIYTKNKILNEAKRVKLNKKGVEVEYLDLGEDVLHAYNIAFSAIFRKLTIKFNLISVSQAHNLVNYGAVNEVNELSCLEDETYEDAVKAYLKSLKTRQVISKTFEKKSK